MSPELLDEEVDRELRGFLAKQLADDGTTSEIAHVVLAGMAAAVAWPHVPHYDALMWVNAVAVAAFGRAFFRRKANTPDADGDTIIAAIRKGVGAVGLAWGAGVLLVGPQLPLEALAWITVLFAGLVAGGTATLLADPRSYYILVITLLVPLGFAIGLDDKSGSHVVGIMLTVAYGVSMAVFYKRAHGMLLKQFRVAKRLEITERAAGEAREAAQRLSSIIEATPDHVVMATPSGRLQYLNRAGREMIGISPEEDVTKLTLLDLSPPRVREQIKQTSMPQLLREGAWAGESTLLHRDGREVRVSLVSQVHRNEQGTAESISAVARDVTDQVATRKALKAARDAAEQATAAKSAFLANTSHEIRTPLNGVLGMVELLLDTELTSEQRRSVELIASSGETLLNTINDVLDLSKIEAAQLDLEATPFDLHQLLHSSVRLFSAKASAANIELVSDVGSDVPPHVVGDSHRLRQILSNLIGNAIKFTSKGEVVLTVRTAGDGPTGPRVRFSVRDTGIGIAPENVARIFQPFGQVDASTTRHYGGTGLGLSISRRLVDLMGGILGVRSDIGRGSDFHFELPMTRSPERASGGAPAQIARGIDGLRVLVVDDHPVNRRVTVDMLRWARCDADDVEGVMAALSRLHAATASGRPYQVVVSDVQMPDRDGFDLASDIRRRPELQQTVVMLLSSGARRGDSDRCRELGVAAYLQKPVSRVELVEAVAAALAEPGAAYRPSLVTRHTIEETRRSLRVLLAEDNAVNQEVATAMLRRRGHEVVVVADGVLAVEAVAAGQRFDLILMDLQMPELDGLEATAQIRQRPNAPPIVALTANVSADERQRCLEAGMSGYVTKPFKPHELFSAVEGWGAGSPTSHAEKPNAPTAKTEEPPPPLDIAGFRGTLADAGIESVGNQMLGIFLEDGQNRMQELAASVKVGDPRAIARAAHAFKSGAANVRALALTALLQAVETSSAAGSIAEARALIAGIENEFTRVADFLRLQLSV